MGKRRATTYSPVLIEANPEDLPPQSSKRQKLACEEAAMALLSFRCEAKHGCLDGPELVKSSLLNKEGNKKHSLEPCVVTSIPYYEHREDSGPITIQSSPFVTRPIKPLVMPRLPHQVQIKRPASLPQGRPVPMAPKLAGHLTKKTKPINLSLK